MNDYTEDIQRVIAETFPELVAEMQADLPPCPAEIADVILRILQTGTVQARSAGWSGDAALSASEADHIHNLPDLLRRYSPRKLIYYWNVERPAYIRRMGGGPMVFEELWAELEPLVPNAEAAA
jgi:hypothetical protein